MSESKNSKKTDAMIRVLIRGLKLITASLEKIQKGDYDSV